MIIGELRKKSDNQLNNIDFYNHITEDGLNAIIEELDRIQDVDEYDEELQKRIIDRVKEKTAGDFNNYLLKNDMR